MQFFLLTVLLGGQDKDTKLKKKIGNKDCYSTQSVIYDLREREEKQTSVVEDLIMIAFETMTASVSFHSPLFVIVYRFLSPIRERGI